MTVPNWNRCAQTMFDIMVSQAESGSPGGTLSLPAKFCYHRSCSCVPGARRWLPGAPACATHHTSPEPLLRRCLGCPQALLEENRHISLTDSPPEEERADEPEAGTPTLVRCAEGCAVLRCAVRCGAISGSVLGNRQGSPDCRIAWLHYSSHYSTLLLLHHCCRILLTPHSHWLLAHPPTRCRCGATLAPSWRGWMTSGTAASRWVGWGFGKC
jgi:hypothetical protein